MPSLSVTGQKHHSPGHMCVYSYLHRDCHQARADEAAAASAAAAAAAAAPVVELLGDCSNVSAGEPGLPVPTDPGAGFGDLLPEVGSTNPVADAASWYTQSELEG